MADQNATPRRVRAILRRLERRFGELVPPRSSDPLEELILTVLSQHTSDVNADRAFTSLMAAFRNCVRDGSKLSRIDPVGPFRCLARINSASRFFS